MNAVERLLAHGEQVVSLFDQMLDSRADPDPLQTECTLRRLLEWHQLGTPFAKHSVELSAAPPRYRRVLTEHRLLLMELWSSDQALDAAARQAIVTAAAEEPCLGYARDLSPLALDLYCRMLERREDLLSPARLQNLAADVVAESPLWGILAERVATLSERAVAVLGILSSENPRAYKRGGNPAFPRSQFNIEVIIGGAVSNRREWLRQRAENVMPALDSLRPYAKPPAAAGSEKKTGGKQPKRRGRKDEGRPPKYPMQFIREVFAARERAEKHAAKARQRLPAWAPWLWDYCQSKISIAEMFPPAFKGEPWQARAARFRKAAKKRLKPPGN